MWLDYGNIFALGNILLNLDNNMTNVVLLLIVLLVCHYLADFCLTTPVMIRAKADGRNLWPIALHATIHTVLIGSCLLVYGIGWLLLLVLMMTELVSHFAIDILKTQISIRFPYWSDNRHKPYWIMYGFDQLLHQIIVVVIWYLAVH